MADAVPTRCDQCGQFDTDPKVHDLNGGTKHHDCLSFDEKNEQRESLQDGPQVAVSAILAERDKGTGGEHLRAFIEREQAKTDKRKES